MKVEKCNMEIGIVGRGAIGLSLLNHLQNRKEHNITLFIRPETAVLDAIYFATQEQNERVLQAQQLPISQANVQKLELIILPIKHYQVAATLEQLSGILPSRTALLLLHNGMGTKELAQKLFPHNPILLGITTDGVYQLSANRFQHVATGKLEVGLATTIDALQDNALTDNREDQELATYWKPRLETLHPNMQWREDIEYAQYQKLAVNAVINPLTALKNCKNGELTLYPKEVAAVKNEVFDLYEFMQLPIDTFALSTQIDEVISLTANNYSSMHQDYHFQRETELDGILGFLIEKAEATGMQLPLINDMYMRLSR
ncbi:ketopantoate reductase family protein [Glaciecola sp. MH2013]|uniref:ketopantoate reductase family protein n=1 Tax=Glaciecola sp. MH2013 TaxID=2785524 RepID=UPI00189EADA0|nr:ketopantoate reductase family protein [Glaciecola sp. MH2013]MBF7072459.1 ketopantoate reductase family protein [Glaciecola sp. MH2013]